MINHGLYGLSLNSLSAANSRQLLRCAGSPLSALKLSSRTEAGHSFITAANFACKIVYVPHVILWLCYCRSETCLFEETLYVVFKNNRCTRKDENLARGDHVFGK